MTKKKNRILNIYKAILNECGHIYLTVLIRHFAFLGSKRVSLERGVVGSQRLYINYSMSFQGVLMLQDQYRAIMQYSIPKDLGSSDKPPSYKASADWFCIKVLFLQRNHWFYKHSTNSQLFFVSKFKLLKIVALFVQSNVFNIYRFCLNFYWVLQIKRNSDSFIKIEHVLYPTL